MEKPFYSLREAARLAGVSEEDLRRRILLGELVAEPVADDRHYLVPASGLTPLLKKRPTPVQTGPTRAERVFCLSAFMLLAFLSIGPLVICLWIGSFQKVDYFCANCTRVLQISRLGQTAVLSRQIEPGPYSHLIQKVEPAPCRHEWVSFRQGRDRWNRLMALEKNGIFSALPESEEPAEVEFIRWVLHREAPLPEAGSTETRFHSVRQIREWAQSPTGGE